MQKVVYPGTFDPITNGHLELVERAAKLFDEVIILISYNITKNTWFTLEERLNQISQAVAHLKNVKVDTYDGLVVKYCEEKGISTIVRGIRNYSDYENEKALFFYNQEIMKGIETVILMPSQNNQFISSSAIKELVKFNSDISKYVPKLIVDEINKKLK